MVKNILRLESLMIIILSLFFYYLFQGNWLYFILGFITIDLSMLGYLVNKKVGAIVYDTIHNLALAIISLLFGIYLVNGILIGFGLILAAHVGMDRLTGFGLKYKTHFKDTHMQKV